MRKPIYLGNNRRSKKGSAAVGGNSGLREFEVYRQTGYLDLVAVVKARSYDEAVVKARRMGYGKGFRVEEVYGNG